MKICVKFFILILTFSLAACSSNFNPFSSGENAPGTGKMTVTQNGKTTTTEENSGGTVGGSISLSMDEFDKTKMFHALDKPVGRSSEWTNNNTGVHYTVTPTKKVEINGNPFCRQYSVNAVKGDHNRQYTGTACVGADSNWQTV